MLESLVSLKSEVIASILGVAMLVSWIIGRWMGRRIRAGGVPTNPTKLDDASLAMLGLLLAFTFGMSIQKHDQRQTNVVADADAIANFYIATAPLAESLRTPLRATLRQYTELRARLAHERGDDAALEDFLHQTQELQVQMIEQVASAVAAGAPIPDSLTSALQGVVSANTTRLAGYRDRLPTSIVVLLFLASIVTVLLIGREEEITGIPEPIGIICIILVVAVTVDITLDLNTPERGLIRVNQEPIERVLSMIKS